MEQSSSSNISRVSVGTNATQSQDIDAYKPVSQEELAAIVASHERLLQWNNATESALDMIEGEADAQLVQNIRNTAAIIATSGRSVASQDFELMRSMNISDRTLSNAALFKAFAEGSLDEVMSPLRKLAEMMQQPADMNLQHSKMRAEALENAIMQAGSNALDIAEVAGNYLESALTDPDHAVDALNVAMKHVQHGYEAQIDQLTKNMAQSLMDENAEQALGYSFGVATVGMIRNTMTKAGRMSRDFSDDMKYFPDEKDFQGKDMKRVFYNPIEGHSINGHVNADGQLHYHIIKSDGDKYGHGNEMFKSMIEKFHKNGVEIHSIRDTWRVNGRDSTNGLQYLEAISAGYSPQEAAFKTFTGRQASDLGFRGVDMPTAEPPFKPIFTKQPSIGGVDQQGRLDNLTNQDLIVGQIKSLGLPADKEQMVIAHVEKNFDIQSRDDSLSA